MGTPPYSIITLNGELSLSRVITLSVFLRIAICPYLLSVSLLVVDCSSLIQKTYNAFCQVSKAKVHQSNPFGVSHFSAVKNIQCLASHPILL